MTSERIARLREEHQSTPYYQAGDGRIVEICRECRENWPCAVAVPLEALDAAEAREMRAIETLAAVSEALLRAERKLERIRKLNPESDSAEGFNEWGEAELFAKAKEIANEGA